MENKGQQHYGNSRPGTSKESVKSIQNLPSGSPNLGSSGTNKMINVLSFDGGGSRGIMEAMVLDDFMRLTTLMKNSPQTDLLKKLRSKNKHDFVKLLHPLDENDQDPISDLIHPTEIFDMIAGKEEY